MQDDDHLHAWLMRLLGPGTRAFHVAGRTLEGTWRDGFIHAGNLAYLTLLALFPFFILDTALFALLGKVSESEVLISAILAAMPHSVAETIKPAALEVLDARHGWLLWAGAVVALWTVSSVIETLRDILRRAYGVRATQPFWKYRLGSIGLILASVIMLMFSFYAQISLTALQALVSARLPNFGDAISWLAATRALPALGLLISFWLLFFTLTPSCGRGSPVWPGALFITLWSMAVTMALPPLLRSFVSYSLIYGSLAGIMITLFFFWLVGLGVVIGAELNAALAKVHDEIGADRGPVKEDAA